MHTISSKALFFQYGLLEAVKDIEYERNADISEVLNLNNYKGSAGEFLHLMANIANMLAKEDKKFYRFKGKLLSTLCNYGDGSVEMFSDRREGVVFLMSKAYGVTTFHHKPEQLENETGYTFVEASFRWSGFKRQHMALDEALNPELLRINIKQSTPVWS